MYFPTDKLRPMFDLEIMGHPLKMPDMRKIPLLFCLAMIAAASLYGQLTVYPGDANNSHLANHVDLLYVGLRFGETGPPRNFFPNFTWTGQSAQAWGGPASVDPAYADCDGTGAIDRSDELGIQQNFGLTHSGSVLPDPNSFGGVNSPHLQINIAPDSFLVQGVTQFVLSLELGSPTQIVDSIYGYALTIDYDPMIVDDVSFAFNPNSFAVDSAGLTLVRIDTVLGKIYVAATNIDHINRMGNGTLATIGIVMDDDIRVAGMWNLLFTPSYFLGFTASEATVPVFPRGDTLVVITGRPAPADLGLEVYPNPATDQISVHSNQHALQRLRLYDMQGRLLHDAAPSNTHFHTLYIDHLPAGCYFLEVHANDGILRRKVVLQSY